MSISIRVVRAILQFFPIFEDERTWCRFLAQFNRLGIVDDGAALLLRPQRSNHYATTLPVLKWRSYYVLSKTLTRFLLATTRLPLISCTFKISVRERAASRPKISHPNQTKLTELLLTFGRIGQFPIVLEAAFMCGVLNSDLRVFSNIPYTCYKSLKNGVINELVRPEIQGSSHLRLAAIG